MKPWNRASPLAAFILSTLCCASLLPSASGQEQSDAHDREVVKFRAGRDKEFRDPKESPLEPAELPVFKALSYFSINPKFRVQARLSRTPDEKKFKMPTSSGTTRVYRKYGELRFTLEGQQQVLTVFQSEALSQTEKYKNYLLIPFRDVTSGQDTYGGGRYIDFEITAVDEVMLDFNLAYNPSCAYSNRYNCPIPPGENRLQVKIKAGEKKYRKLTGTAH
ncbi:MAG: DUF1684 domain-containing protein [Acidobacteriota bacterium]